MKPNNISFIILLAMCILSSSTGMSTPCPKRNRTVLKGIYADPSKNSFIEITREKMYIYTADSMRQTIDTLAECDYEILNSEFIEIRTSEDSFPYPYKNYDIVIDTVCVSSMITVEIPNITVPLVINLDSGNESGCYVLDNNNNHSITVKCDYIYDLSFYILPENISYIPFKSDGIDNGIVLFHQLFYNNHNNIYKYLYDILDNYNFRAHIKIKIPDLTDATFTSMYIPGDYIRYKDKKLFWRGKVFKMMDA